MTVEGRPELGWTLSREDGAFDLGVNGGESLTLDVQLEGYFPAHRPVRGSWNAYEPLEPVALVPFDSVVTTVDLAGATAIQTARGSVVADSDGVRQATVLFKPGTQAALEFPDGTQQSIDTLSVHATEYTVGENGLLAMPAPLPPRVEYTYAVELSVDEALAAGATSVSFDQPVPLYVENFLGFPVGEIVPMGFYDREAATWVASDNGRVIEIVDTAGGLAAIDGDGDGLADDSAALGTLGFNNAEREHLATLYSPGQRLWRFPLDHLTPWDGNLPPDAGLPPDAESPPDDGAETGDGEEDECMEDSSIIGCETQSLGEMLGLVGTPFSLHYTSQRAPGKKDRYRLQVPLTDDSVPASLERVEVQMWVAGRGPWKTVEVCTTLDDGRVRCWWEREPDLQWNYDAVPGQTHEFTWDGRDAFGRELQGGTSARIRIGFVYPAGYQTPVQDPRAFGLGGDGTNLTTTRSNEVVLSRTFEAWVGPWDGRSFGLGGWSLSEHHQYHPGSKTIYLGDGTERRPNMLNPVISAYAGTGLYCNSEDPCGEGEPAKTARLDAPNNLAAAPDGSLYYIEEIEHRILKIDPDGILATIAGTGSAAISADGGLATESALYYPSGLAVGPDGSIYVAERHAHRIRRIGPDGIITTIAGTGTAGYSGDGGAATSAMLNQPLGMDFGPDGSLYFADSQNRRVRKIDPSGIITTVAGNGVESYAGDDGPARDASLRFPTDVAVGSAGKVYISSSGIIRYVDRAGIMRRLNQHYTSGNVAVAAADDESVYIVQSRVVQQLWRERAGDDLDQRIAGSTIAACSYRVSNDPDCSWDDGDGGAAVQSLLHAPKDVEVGPDGSIYIAETGFDQIRRIAPPLPGLTLDETAVASESGDQVYVFDAEGRHQTTRSALTGEVLLAFDYTDGLLTSITDADSLVTTVERATDGTPTAIVAPYGQRTTLTLDSNDWLSQLTDPADQTVAVTHDSLGLLTGMVDARDGTHSYDYDSLGRLIADTDADGTTVTLGRTDVEDGHDVAFTTALGRTTTYRLLRPGRSVRREVTGPDGLTATSVKSAADVTRVTQPDGTNIVRFEGGDPRFSTQAPMLDSLVVSTPGGLSMVVAGKRDVTLADPGNPLSLSVQLDSTIVNGRVHTTRYEQATGTFTATMPTGRQSFTTVDVLGRVVRDSLPGVAASLYGYNALGRPDSVRQGVRAWSFDYDAQGRLLSTTDPLGRSDSLFYDAASRVTRQVLRDGREITYGYDAGGNLTSLAPPGRPAHTFTYNAVGLDSIYDPPDVTGLAEDRTFYSYNADQDLTRILRPDGQAVNFAYDSAGRVDAITAPRGVVDYAYSATTGQLTGITAPGGEVLSFAYDGSLPTLEAWSGTVSGQVGFAYDNDFRLSGLTVNGDTVAYGYDADGLLTAAGDLAMSRDSLNGFLSSTTLGGVTTRRGYNELGEVSGDSAWANGVLVFARSYMRDDLGRIKAVEDFADGVTTLWEYGYDVAGRLETVTRNGAAYASYEYDANGNRLSRTSPAGVESGTYDAQDRLLSYAGATYSYTANGELTEKVEGADTTRYAYDVFGNLTRVDLPDGTVIEYLIDGRNRRVGKKVDGVLVQGFLYGDQLNPVAELDSLGNVVSRFIYGSKANVPNYMVRGGDTLRVLSDHLGSVRMVVNTSTGAVVQRLSYDAWGRVLEDTNPGFQPFGFAGGLWEERTGLVRFGARDYVPSVGRWTSKDPIGLLGGLNVYAFVWGNPVGAKDIFGLCPTEECQIPEGPPHANLDRWIWRLRSVRTLGGPAGEMAAKSFWIAMVWKKQPWDWKRHGASQEFGNFWYGATGRAVGFTTTDLLLGSAVAQRLFSERGSGPLGDNADDPPMIRAGARYFNRGCWR